ncbi:hypothetical protein [Wenjunlia vitaminophila]|uniref:hypothetical protein n=1 Tax=Wenjunlia vitaminophila TaxID=76728 RepID=UPI00036EB7A9|nr:hypothetical protein [Wenjunlia vitaminophila]
MSEARTDTIDNRMAEAEAGPGNGKHRGPAADDSQSPATGLGHGRHRRPTPVQDPMTRQ